VAELQPGVPVMATSTAEDPQRRGDEDQPEQRMNNDAENYGDRHDDQRDKNVSPIPPTA